MSKLEKHLKKTTEEYNMIHVRSEADIHNLNNRYVVVKDVLGTYRVVSLVRKPYRELQPRESIGGPSYVFNRTGMNPSWDKTSYNQAQLANMVKQYGKKVDQVTLSFLKKDGTVSVAEDARIHEGTKPSDFAGLPRFDNHQLDPQKGGWIIATVTKDGLLFGSKPKVHTNQGAAEAELQRLATVSPGTEFVLMKAVKTAITQTVQTKEFA